MPLQHTVGCAERGDQGHEQAGLFLMFHDSSSFGGFDIRLAPLDTYKDSRLPESKVL
ncbi:MAG: hypothetical protein KAV83_10210 [Desulfobacterales bacterium]|nr:hypothetical protein [Desulfobacterales bacterium]